LNLNEAIQGSINTYSSPSDLKITDIRVTEIEGAPMDCGLIKVFTNSDLVGFGEVRDFGSVDYVHILKSRILGENPCNVDKLFRRIKQFGGHARQAGGVTGIELALWDLAGKAYNVPVYQLLGGKFRDDIRMYCDTDVDGKPDGKAMGRALKKRMDQGFTFLKMDLGINEISHIPGALSAPLGFLDLMNHLTPDLMQKTPSNEAERTLRNKSYDLYNIAHPFTGIHVTETGFEALEQYVMDVRSVIGYEVPLSIDHFGHIGVEDCIKLARRVEKFNLAWLEDMIPWQFTEQYKRLSSSCTVPICTGEDIYLKENFRPLLESGALSVIHPDILTSGGILENKKIGDMAQEYGVSMAIHMAESPIACLAAVHSAAATENFLVLEYHSNDVPWWDDLVTGPAKPIVQNGFIKVPDSPGLGIESLNDEVIAEHLKRPDEGLWKSTEEWNSRGSYDRLWS